jgi:nitrogen fixation protein NifX
MKIAFASSDGAVIDRHFGQAEHYFVWEVGPGTAEFLGRVSPLTCSGDEEDRTAARASAVADCAIVYSVQIGGPAAAKLVSRRIHPMKTQAEVPVAEALAKLQAVLAGSPPPWLRKAMNGGA